MAGKVLISGINISVVGNKTTVRTEVDGLWFDVLELEKTDGDGVHIIEPEDIIIKRNEMNDGRLTVGHLISMLRGMPIDAPVSIEGYNAENTEEIGLFRPTKVEQINHSSVGEYVVIWAKLAGDKLP
jgi:hypothetical protein